MTHIDEDILLKSALNILDENEEKKVKLHLSECVICSENFNKISDDINFFSTFDIDIKEKEFPTITKKNNFSWIKNAAVILVVLGLGIATSQFSQNDDIIVVKQSIHADSPTLSDSLFEPCPNIDVW